MSPLLATLSSIPGMEIFFSLNRDDSIFLIQNDGATDSLRRACRSWPAGIHKWMNEKIQRGLNEHFEDGAQTQSRLRLPRPASTSSWACS
jgi:hypothetical protein